jgi:hypothetical protein
LGHLESRETRHLNVEKHEVGLVTFNGGEGFDSVAGLRDNFGVAQLLELKAQLIPCEPLVVDD